jgi:hypothetical protein
MPTPNAYQVEYWEKSTQRWVRAGRYPNGAQADEKANELRLAGYEARVAGVWD